MKNSMAVVETVSARLVRNPAQSRVRVAAAIRMATSALTAAASVGLNTPR